VRVVISSEFAITHLFRSDEENDNPDEHRMLMDDLGIKLDSDGAKASIFTGEEEQFAFDRTISRLSEMQSKEYWEAWEKTR